LELTYGVPLIVPLVERITAELLKVVDGCSAGGAGGRAWACLFYDSVDENGNFVPRLPVLVSSQVRMQTPARRSDMNVASSGTAPTGSGLGVGQVDSSATFRPLPLSAANPQGAPSADGIASGQAEFLRFGADRVLPVPAACRE
jgi:hypothetical protein